MIKKLFFFVYIIFIAIVTQMVTDIIYHGESYGIFTVSSRIITHDSKKAKRVPFEVYCCSEKNVASLLKTRAEFVPDTGKKDYLFIRSKGGFTFPASFQYQIDDKGWFNGDIFQTQYRYTSTVIPYTGGTCSFGKGRWLIYDTAPLIR